MRLGESDETIYAMRIRYGCYEVDEVESLEAALESALAGESAALEEVARLKARLTNLDARRWDAQVEHGIGIAEERARWEARLERLRGAYAQAQKWNDRDKECDRRQERALAVAIAIMSGEGEVKP